MSKSKVNEPVGIKDLVEAITDPSVAKNSLNLTSEEIRKLKSIAGIK